MAEDRESFRRECGEWALAAVEEAIASHNVVMYGDALLEKAGPLPPVDGEFLAKVQWYWLAECYDGHEKHLCPKQTWRVRKWLERKGGRIDDFSDRDEGEEWWEVGEDCGD